MKHINKSLKDKVTLPSTVPREGSYNPVQQQRALKRLNYGGRKSAATIHREQAISNPMPAPRPAKKAVSQAPAYPRLKVYSKKEEYQRFLENDGKVPHSVATHGPPPMAMTRKSRKGGSSAGGTGTAVAGLSFYSAKQARSPHNSKEDYFQTVFDEIEERQQFLQSMRAANNVEHERQIISEIKERTDLLKKIDAARQQDPDAYYL